MSNRPSTRGRTAVTIAGLIASGFAGVLTAAPAHAATVEYTVSTSGKDTNICLGNRPCRTVAAAIAKAIAAGNVGNDVRIRIGRGTFDGVTIDTALGWASLTIDGDGEDRTKLRPVSTTVPIDGGPGLAGVAVATLTAPVAVEDLSVVGRRIPAAAPGADGADVAGIASVHLGALIVRDVEIENLTGGAGGPGAAGVLAGASGSDGGVGGAAFGVYQAPAAPPAPGVISRVEDVSVQSLTGGAGGRGGNGRTGAAAENGGDGGVGARGGSVSGVFLAAPEAQVARTAVISLIGGDGGVGGNAGAPGTGAVIGTEGVGGAGGGGGAVSVVAERGIVGHSRVTDLRGGCGGAPGAPQGAGVNGGSGGLVTGVRINASGSVGVVAAVLDSAVTRLRGGAAGLGVVGGAAYGVSLFATNGLAVGERMEITDVMSGAAGADGPGGSFVAGLSLSSNQAGVRASTIAGIRGAAGAAGLRNTAWPGGSRGGNAVGVYVTNGAPVLTDSTITDVKGGAGGRGGGTATAPGVGGAGGYVNGIFASGGSPLTLRHVTLTDVVPGTAGASGSGTPVPPTAADGEGVLIESVGGTIEVTASLLDSPRVLRCVTSAPALFTDGGYNALGAELGGVIPAAPCAFGPTSPLVLGLGASLGTLRDNGGPTRTRSLPDNGWPYQAVPISSGMCTGVNGNDQRGFGRPGAAGPAACAAGAYEPQGRSHGRSHH